jgi:hypothetical protein
MIGRPHALPFRPACRALVPGVSCAGARCVAALFAAEWLLTFPELEAA